MKNVLVTGGAGFIGSAFVRMAAKAHSDWRIVNVDALTYAGSLENIAALQGVQTHVFVRGDVTDRAQMQALFDAYHFDWVVHFAAETHVDRSIAAPDIFTRTNVLGTQHLLDCARSDWQIGQNDAGYPLYRPGVRFLQISTDEVYGARLRGRFAETAPLSPGSPYAASKAAADLLVGAYVNTYRLPCNITRSANNYGPYQYPEKLIPLAIGRALDELPVPVYGDGLQVRDWLHVDDHCRALLAVLASGRPGEIYNVGAGDLKTNIDIVRRILALLRRPETLISHVQDRPGHDRRYALDCRKITRELGWKPAVAFDTGLADTIDWYKNHPERRRTNA